MTLTVPARHAPPVSGPSIWPGTCSACRSTSCWCLMLIEALLSAATTYLVIKAGRDFTKDELLICDLLMILAAQSAIVHRRRDQLDLRRARRLPRLWPLHAAIRPRQSASDQVARPTKRRANASNRSSPGRRSTSISTCCSRSKATLRLLLGLVFNVIVLGTQIDGSLPAGLRRRFCRAVRDAMDDAQADFARLSRKPAHDQPHDGAGLHRVGQHLHRQPLQSPALAGAASRPSCATVSMRRSRRS